MRRPLPIRKIFYQLPAILQHFQESLYAGAKLAFVAGRVVGADMQEGHAFFGTDVFYLFALHIKWSTSMNGDADNAIYLLFRKGAAQLLETAGIGRHYRAGNLKVLFCDGRHRAE